MNLLVLTNNPNRASFRQRIGIYKDKLHNYGLNCEVAVFPSGNWARQKLFRLTRHFDAVFLHKKPLNPFDAFWLKQCAEKIFYDFDDAIMYSPKNPDRNSFQYLKAFQRTVKLADVVIAGNSYLADHAKKFNRNVHVLPTGLDVAEYKVEPRREEDGKVRLVWIGSKSTLRYLEEIKPALEQIGRHFKNVVLRIICDKFFDLNNLPVEKHHWSLETQAHDLACSDIGLSPLSDNRFTRGKCGFKILQYQAVGLPVITSPVGINSEYVKDGITGFYAQDIDQWIDKISRLVDNSRLRKQMGMTGDQNIKKLDIEVIEKKLCELIIQKNKSAIKTNVDCSCCRDTPDICSPKQKTVSICIPTYNRRQYLRETIDSIRAQTYKDYEIVVVDDGSTDGTEDMIKGLGFPVTYVWQQNSGDAAARNTLVQHATGKYISFIDSDDLLLPDAIEKMVEAMETEKEDVVVYGSYFRIDKNGYIYGRCKKRLYSGNITSILFETILVHCGGSLFPRKILDRPLPFDTSLKVCSDYDFWLQLSARYRFVAVSQPTFLRRRHRDNLSTACFENCLTEYKVLERFYYEKGGQNLIPKTVAMRVLSKEACRAGCYARREGLYDQAYQMLANSFRKKPNLKSLVNLAMAKTLNFLFCLGKPVSSDKSNRTKT